MKLYNYIKDRDTNGGLLSERQTTIILQIKRNIIQLYEKKSRTEKCEIKIVRNELIETNYF